MEYTINGNNFKTMNGFYNEIEKVFTFNLNWRIGRNLDAFNDILRGEFGMHEYGEPILIKWIHYEKSISNLGVDKMQAITNIILDTDNTGHDCILKKM